MINRLRACCLFVFINFIVLQISNCQDYNEIRLIPAPNSFTLHKGAFSLGNNIDLKVEDTTLAVASMAKTLITNLKAKLPINKAGNTSSKVQIKLTGSDSLGEEGYYLKVGKDNIYIEAFKPAGIFYAIQTINQIIFHSQLPCIEITDVPRFSWRGMMLDVSRHFFNKEEIKRYIDLLAYYKLNKFHWHLTDDQGWRIEIKKYPELTSKGAWRQDRRGEPWTHSQNEPVEGKPVYGGFYTQEDVKEIIRYASERFITVVPEIDMPGHSWAAMYAYPWLSCDRKIWRKPENVSFEFSDPLCICKDSVVMFAKDVLNEIIDLFPSPYIHIGGDECKYSPWLASPLCQEMMEKKGIKKVEDLHSWFNNQLEETILSRGRKMIGWDEILEGENLSKSTVIMSWRGEKGGIEAAKMGHDVVMTPSSHLYFDMPQDAGLPLKQKLIDLATVYSYNPVPAELGEMYKSHILGCQSNLWTEEIQNANEADSMLLPRLCALSEIAWTNNTKKDYNSFCKRLISHLDFLEEKKFGYYIPLPVINTEELFLKSTRIEMSSPLLCLKIRYTLNGKEPDSNSKLYTGPIKISKDVTLKAKVYLPNGKSGGTLVSRIRKTSALPSLTMTNNDFSQGVKTTYYEGKISKLEDMDTMKAVTQLNLSTFEIPTLARKDFWGMKCSAFINIPETAIYTFYLDSDDGSSLIIDGKEVINIDGIHGRVEKKGSVALVKGWHKINLNYFEGNYGEYLNLQWSYKKCPKGPIPDKILMTDVFR